MSIIFLKIYLLSDPNVLILYLKMFKQEKGVQNIAKSKV